MIIADLAVLASGFGSRPTFQRSEELAAALRKACTAFDMLNAVTPVILGNTTGNRSKRSSCHRTRIMNTDWPNASDNFPTIPPMASSSHAGRHAPSHWRGFDGSSAADLRQEWLQPDHSDGSGRSNAPAAAESRAGIAMGRIADDAPVWRQSAGLKFKPEGPEQLDVTCKKGRAVGGCTDIIQCGGGWRASCK